jgi:drug/metabolite transporter (DMT)-like permease
MTSVDDVALAPSLAHGRLCIVLAALLWSTSGAFTKVLTKPTFLELHTPEIDYLLIAFYRALFAGLALVPLLRPRDISFRPMMLPMVTSFAVMNATFVLALAIGTAANAIVLQYTAPMWMYLACVWWLGEKADQRSLTALAIGLVGIVVIVFGGWEAGQLPVVILGLVSGVAYAGVMVSLRVLHESSSRWLTTINHLVSALVLVPFVYTLPWPTWPQLGVLFVYGAVQMSVPYWLVARGVRSVSPQEAGTITLLEPLLNPLWAYLVSGEEPKTYTLIGGAFIVGALAWRYWPRSGKVESSRGDQER